MIAYVEGRCAERTENSCVVVTQSGVGYEVFLPAHTLTQLPEKSEITFFYINTVVREDVLELFGFSTWDERQTFLLLTSINRVGPRTALAILSVFRPDDLRRLVINEDVTLLTRVPGIGKKTAQQVFLELKYKLKVDDVTLLGDGALQAQPSLLNDTVAGLVNLGYEENAALQVVKKVLTDAPNCDVSEALRAALKFMAKGR